MSKKRKQSINLAIIAIVFSIIVFFIPFPKGATFWIAYIAELIALVLQIPIFKLAYSNVNDLKSKVLGFPVFRVGYIYLGVQTTVSLILFALGFIKNFPLWISVVLCVIILAMALVCSMATDMARDTVTEIEATQAVDTHLIKEHRLKSQQLVSKTNDSELRKKLEQLAENFSYSDPVSSPSIFDAERKLTDCFAELELAVINDDTAKASELCKAVEIALNDRNMACKLNKQR
ncbi:MAG: hypothetical protein K2G88_07360 [Oscillospiraceae bacterium]|nr:hypothetical protein [Oscillospiraceae bacterium]